MKPTVVTISDMNPAAPAGRPSPPARLALTGSAGTPAAGEPGAHAWIMMGLACGPLRLSPGASESLRVGARASGTG